MSTDYSEDTLVEQPAIALFSELGYDTANCFRLISVSAGTAAISPRRQPWGHDPSTISPCRGDSEKDNGANLYIINLPPDIQHEVPKFAVAPAGACMLDDSDSHGHAVG